MGPFVSAVAQRAAELQAELIIVPPGDGQFGTIVTTLAQVAETSVLVTRAKQPAKSILAATELTQRDEIVLGKAAELASRLRAPLVTLYNRPPEPAAVGSMATSEVEPSLEERLRRASPGVGVPGARARVTHEKSPAHAILLEASSLDAGVVVVGGSNARIGIVSADQALLGASSIGRSAPC